MEQLIFNPVRAEQITHCSAYDKYSAKPDLEIGCKPTFSKGFKPSFVRMFYEPVWIGSSFKCVYIEFSDIQTAGLTIVGNRVFGTAFDLRIVDQKLTHTKLIVARADGVQKITYWLHCLRPKATNAYFAMRMKAIEKFLDMYKKIYPPFKLRNPKGIVFIRSPHFKAQIASQYRDGVKPHQKITLENCGKEYVFTVIDNNPSLEVIVATNTKLPKNWVDRNWTYSEIRHLPEFDTYYDPKYDRMAERLMKMFNGFQRPSRIMNFFKGHKRS
jgi:hypothetical protein